MATNQGLRTEVLTTVDELKDFCRNNGIVMGAKRKQQLVDAIKSDGYWTAFCKTVECSGCGIYETECVCTELLEKLKADHAMDMASMRQELESKREELVALFLELESEREERESVRKELESEREEREELESKHQEFISLRDREHSKEMASKDVLASMLEEEHRGELESAREEHRGELESVREEYIQKLLKLCSERSTPESGDLREELADLREKHSKEMAELRETHSKKMADSDEAHRKEIDKLLTLRYQDESARAAAEKKLESTASRLYKIQQDYRRLVEERER